ncbi:MAG TPA: response regulator [Azospirillaceae bacterium]|nr:response regulator [Azospirillaceae bacterium]HRQ79728.1 response regulator [Azospirillaceae bacterium]
MRILVVDDVPVVSMVIAKALHRAGHETTIAANGDEALARLHEVRFDVLVTDIWMPGKDGMDLIRTSCAQWPSMGVVAMSGGDPHQTMDRSLDMALAAGAQQVLMKPIDKDELLAAVVAAARTKGKVQL